MEATLFNRVPAAHISLEQGTFGRRDQDKKSEWSTRGFQTDDTQVGSCSCRFGCGVHAAAGSVSLTGRNVARREPSQSRRRVKTIVSVISPERTTKDLSRGGRDGAGRGSDFTREGAIGSEDSLLRPLKPRGSVTLPEQQIVLDPYAFVSDSESDSETDIAQTKRKKVDAEATQRKERKTSSRASDEKGTSQKDSKEGLKTKGLREGVKAVKSTSEGVVSESVARLTKALEQVTGGSHVAGVPVAKVIAKGISGAVKGGCAASMAESVGMHVGGGALEVAALRGALTGAIADIVSLFIDPPAQEMGEDAVEKGEQAAEEFEARLRQKSGGTMIIKREKTVDGRMGKIVGVEKKKGSKKAKKEDSLPEGGLKHPENEGEENRSDVHADKTASEGVKEEGMVWGQMEEREETTAVAVVGNAVDLGTKAVTGAMKGAIWGAAQEAANNGFVPHGVARGAISGAFGDTIASRVDPLAKKSQESIKGREKNDENEKRGTVRRKVAGAEQETKVLRDEKTKAIDKGPESKEDEVTDVSESRDSKQVKVRSGATLHIVEGKQTEEGEPGKVPFHTDSSLTFTSTSEESGLEHAVKVGKQREKEARASGKEDKMLSAIDESFRSGLEAVPEEVIPKQGPAFDDETEEETGESKPGTKKLERDVGKVTGAQLARPRSKIVDGLAVNSDHGSLDLDFQRGFGGSEVVIEDVQLAERIEAEEGVPVEVEGGLDNPVSEQLVLLNEKGVQMKKQEKGFWTEEQQAEVEKTALKKLTRALGGAVKGAATGAMTEMATTGTFSGIGAVKGAVGGAVADLAADVADPIAEQVGKEESDGEEAADVEDKGGEGNVDVTTREEVDVKGDNEGEAIRSINA